MFVSLEGIDGSGKTTMCEALKKMIAGSGLKCFISKEPGGNSDCEAIRNILLHPQCELPLEAEINLFLASRCINVHNLIKPALKDGFIVISDRFCDSIYAYQSYGKGYDLHLLKERHNAACGGLMPDITFLLDISVEEALKRNTDDDRFTADCSFLEKVRSGYLTLAKEEPQRIIIIDAALQFEKKLEFITNTILSHFGEEPK